MHFLGFNLGNPAQKQKGILRRCVQSPPHLPWDEQTILTTTTAFPSMLASSHTAIRTTCDSAMSQTLEALDEQRWSAVQAGVQFVRVLDADEREGTTKSFRNYDVIESNMRATSQIFVVN